MYSLALTLALLGQISAADQTDLALATCRVLDSHGTGSAISIGRKGDFEILLTAAHVVDSSKTKVQRFSRDSYPSPAATYYASVIAKNTTTDLALLAIKTSDSFLGLRVSQSAVRVPFSVAWAGCAQGRAPVAQTAKVVEVRNETSRGGRSWITNAPPQPGQSGGPLVDKSGRLIGIVSFSQGETIGGFCHLDDIHDLLDDAGLADLYKSRPSRPEGGRRPPDYPRPRRPGPQPGPFAFPDTDIDFEFGFRVRIIVDGETIRIDEGRHFSPGKQQRTRPPRVIIIDEQNGDIRVEGFLVPFHVRP